MPKRYFKNPFPEYNPQQDIHIDAAVWRPKIKEIVEFIRKHQKIDRRACDGGLYVGLGGVAYALWYLSTKLPDSGDLLKDAQTFSAAQLQYCRSHDVSRKPSERLGFLLGNTGIEATSAVIAKYAGDQHMASQLLANFQHASKDMLHVDPLGCGSDEMLVGRAGYLSGALWLQKILGEVVVPQDKLYAICDTMLDVGRRYATGYVNPHYTRQRGSPCPLMYQYYGTEYLGAGHGLTGILQMMLTVPGYLKHNPGAEADIRGSVDYIVSIQLPDGNFPCAMDELGEQGRGEEDLLVHWCHGAPGTVYLLARAHLLWGGDKYLASAHRAADCCWAKGLLKKGPGICHGVAGTGYVFLLMYRLTGDRKHLYRASKCAEFLYSADFKKARTPDTPLSLYEGWSGTVCFLADLLYPESASFPFSEVFP